MERGKEGEREGEKHLCVVDSHASPARDLDCNPGMCPDWESDWPPFGLQAGAQSTEPHQPGLYFKIKIIKAEFAATMHFAYDILGYRH